jgi:hypothetical protein
VIQKLSCADPSPDPQVGSTQDLFLSARELDWLFYFPFGKSTHNNTLRKFLSYFRISDFANSRILWSSTLPLRPPKPKIFNHLVFLMSISAFRLSRIQELRCHATLPLDSRTSDSRFAEIQMSRSPFSLRDFGVSTTEMRFYYTLGIPEPPNPKIPKL